LSDDVPAPADYDGDGSDDLAVYRQATGEWFIVTSSSGFSSWRKYLWGVPGDIPVTMAPRPVNPLP
jgi:hypothetical protein